MNKTLLGKLQDHAKESEIHEYRGIIGNLKNLLQKPEYSKEDILERLLRDQARQDLEMHVTLKFHQLFVEFERLNIVPDNDEVNYIWQIFRYKFIHQQNLPKFLKNTYEKYREYLGGMYD